MNAMEPRPHAFKSGRESRLTEDIISDDYPPSKRTVSRGTVDNSSQNLVRAILDAGKSQIPQDTLLPCTQCVPADAFVLRSRSPIPFVLSYLSGNAADVLRPTVQIEDLARRPCGILYGMEVEDIAQVLRSRSSPISSFEPPCTAFFALMSEMDDGTSIQHVGQLGAIDTARYQQKRYSVLNVLLLKEQGNSACVERVAVGQIHAEAWDMMYPEPRAILLH